MVIPVPPAAEQRRIVAKVDQLMTLIDQLEELQTNKNKVAGDFAQAAVASITGTQIKQSKGNMTKLQIPNLSPSYRLASKPKVSDEAPLAVLISKHKALWQQSGLEIDAFYQQLRTEMANGWIVEPEKAVMKEFEAS